MIINKIILGVAMALLCGCALTTEQVDFHYQVNKRPTEKTHSTMPIILDSATDARGLPANLIIHKTNENLQEASGGYATPKPVSTYLDSALRTGLTEAGYHLVKNKTPLHLNVKLLNIRYNWEEDFFKSTVYCSIQVEFSLTNSKTGKQLWDDTLFAKSGVIKENSIPAALNSAINQLANDLATNKSFQSNL